MAGLLFKGTRRLSQGSGPPYRREVHHTVGAEASAFRSGQGSDRQQPPFLSDSDRRESSAVELKIVGLDAVAEDDAVLGHLRHDGHPVRMADSADDNISLRYAAWKGLAYEIVQIGSVR